MKPLSKIIKILTFVFSLIMVFALCGCDMCSTSQPDMVVETADFEYTTILNLKEMYKVSDEELLRDISSYGEEEGFALYKRAYSNFLNTPNYRIVTTGYSKVDTMGGITVDVNNEKKFDGTNFFMHTLSISEKGGITASMSNKNSKHYFYVTDNPLENLATINQLDVKDENKILSTVTCTEKNYVFNYGAIPYAVCDYVVNESTILESSLSFDDETGLYKIEFVLEPVSATVNLVKKMYMISNTSATYKGGSVKYIVYVDSDFIIRKTTENETYNVDAPIVGNVSAEGMTEDCFYYVGDKNFLPLSEDQKYDLSKIPTEEAQEEVNVEAQESSKRAFCYIAENGINSNFDLSIGDTSLSGRLQLSTENNIELQIDTEFGEEIMIYLSLDENNNCLIKANYGDIKIAVVVDNVGDAVTQIISLLGVDLDGIDIGDIIANLNIKDFFSSIVGLEGEVENGVYTFESDTSKLGFPLALPFTMSVCQDRITSFELNNVDLEGLSLSLKFEACSEPKNMEQNLIEEDRVDLSSLVKFALNDLDVDLIMSIVENKTVSFDVTGKIFDKDLMLKVDIDFSNEIKAIAQGKIMDVDFSIYFENDALYISIADDAVFIDINSIINLFGEVDFELQPIQIEEILSIIRVVINESSYVDNTLNLSYDKLLLAIYDSAISIGYDNNISLEINNISSVCDVYKPDKDYQNILQDIDIELIKEIVENKKVSFDIEAKLSDFELSGNVQLDFNDGIKLQASGTVEGITFSAYLENDIVYLKLNGIKVQVSIDELMGYLSELNIELPKIEIDGILEIVKEILSNTTYEESEIEVTYKDIALTLKDMALTLKYNDISLNVTNISSSCEIEEKESDYEDILNDIDLDLILEIVENKKVSFDIEAKLLDFELSGNVQLDFNDGIKLQASGTIEGITFSAYLENDIVYLKVNGIKVQVSIDELMGYLSELNIELPKIEIDGILEIVKEILSNTTYEESEIEVTYNDIVLTLKDMALTLKYNNISANVTNISSSCEIEEKGSGYEDILNDIDLDLILEIVENKKLSFDIEAKIQDFELSGNVQLDFNDGIKLQASGTVEGITFSAYLENGIVYLKVNGIKVQVSIDELMGYLSELNIELPKIEIDGILEIVKEILSNTTYKESEIEVKYKDIALTLKDMALTLKYKDISLNVTNISSSCEIEEKGSGYEDILNDIDLDLILEIVENKKVSFDIEANLSDFELNGNVQLDFNDGLKAYVSGVIDGAEFTAYYEDEIVYLMVGDVAVSVSINTIFEYANIFTEVNLPEVDLTNLILVIKDVLEVVDYKDSLISLLYKDIYLSVDHMNISASYESISAMIKNISSEASCVKPNVNYQSVEGLNKLLESVNKQLSERYFTANGLITLGDITIELKDIKVHNAGELLDPTTAFNNGDLTLSGVIIITASNKQHKLNVSYVNDNLYISYNEKLNIKLSREALDEIVDIVKVNFKNVLERLNYMELIPIETIEKLMNFEFNLGVIPKVLKEISCNNGALTLGLDTSIIDLDKFITLIASVSEYDILSLTVSVDEYDGTITLDNSEFDSIVAPEGDYLEFSGITKLIEGLVNAILKESGEYYLSGKISLSLDSPILGALGGNVEMGVDVRIRLVDDEESELGKKLEVYVKVDTSKDSLVMKTVSAFGYIHAGTGILMLKDGMFYIERTNIERGLFNWKTQPTKRIAVTREYFGSHILEEVGLFLGFGDALNDKINEGATEEKQEIKVEELINNYSVNNGTHEIVLVGSSLLKNDMVSMGNITIDLTLEDLNSDPEIQDEQLTTLKAKVPLTIIGFLEMTAEVDATHDVYKTDIDFSYIENLNPQNYTLLG